MLRDWSILQGMFKRPMSTHAPIARQLMPSSVMHTIHANVNGSTVLVYPARHLHSTRLFNKAFLPSTFFLPSHSHLTSLDAYSIAHHNNTHSSQCMISPISIYVGSHGVVFSWVSISLGTRTSLPGLYKYQAFNAAILALVLASLKLGPDPSPSLS